MLKNNARLFIIIGLIAIVVASVLIYFGIYYLEADPIGKKVSTEKTQEQEYREAISIAKKIIKKTLYYRLAFLDAGWEIPATDIKVKRFKYLLRSLEKKCRGSREEITSQVIALQERIISKYGKKIRLQAILEGVNRSITKGNSEVKFYRQAVRYAVERAR